MGPGLRNSILYLLLFSLPFTLSSDTGNFTNSMLLGSPVLVHTLLELFAL